MIVSRIQPANRKRSDQSSKADDRPSATSPASMALVPVAPPVATSHPAHSHYRPDPAFVAHLIAIAQQSPQTRNLRRASTDEAHGRYQAARPANTTASGLMLSRVA